MAKQKQWRQLQLSLVLPTVAHGAFWSGRHGLPWPGVATARFGSSFCKSSHVNHGGSGPPISQHPADALYQFWLLHVISLSLSFGLSPHPKGSGEMLLRITDCGSESLEFSLSEVDVIKPFEKGNNHFLETIRRATRSYSAAIVESHAQTCAN